VTGGGTRSHGVKRKASRDSRHLDGASTDRSGRNRKEKLWGRQGAGWCPFINALDTFYSFLTNPTQLVRIKIG